MATAANLVTEGGDPRLIETTGNVGRLIHDPSVPFEAYIHYASITRAEEKIANEEYIHAAGPKTFQSFIKNRFSKGSPFTPSPPPVGDHAAIKKDSAGEKGTEVSTPPSGTDPMVVTDAEWKRASRAIRTAGWSAIFYLITTDILGPYSVPWAFAQMGYGPGVALYTVFAAFAGYSGYILWHIFLHLDSDQYPLLSYGDLFYRVYGKVARQVVNVCQVVQMILTVSALILSNGQAISQISKGNFCFVACLVVFMAAGMILGQIRTLQRFGWVANFAVWINLLIIFIVMGVAANSTPNFAATTASFGDGFAPGPIHRYAGTPPDGMASGGSGFVGSLNGLNQAVYSYGGAMLFVAFLAEMRHPLDFWKGLLCATVFIYTVYMFFGIFVYSYQGQFAYNPVMQGLSPYNWQTAANVLTLITGLIAAALYGNIGIKVAYIEIFQELFKVPALTSRTGKLLWIVMVPLYWGLAFIIAAAIPQFSDVTGLIGALCILSFTYTFPALLAVGYQIKVDAMTAEEHFDPATGAYHSIDRGMQRIVRGFMKKWWLNGLNFIYFLGSLTTCILGVYSSVVGLKAAFNGGSVATSFGCASPVA